MTKSQKFDGSKRIYDFIYSRLNIDKLLASETSIDKWRNYKQLTKCWYIFPFVFITDLLG